MVFSPLRRNRAEAHTNLIAAVKSPVTSLN